MRLSVRTRARALFCFKCKTYSLNVLIYMELEILVGLEQGNMYVVSSHASSAVLLLTTIKRIVACSEERRLLLCTIANGL